MYKNDLNKLPLPTLKKLRTALRRSRDASQNIFDLTQGVIKQNAGRKELGQHLRWYENQLNKVEEVIFKKIDSMPIQIRKIKKR